MDNRIKWLAENFTCKELQYLQAVAKVTGHTNGITLITEALAYKYASQFNTK